MYLIVGLGNPGRRYKDTPHNTGFEAVNAFRDLLKIKGYECDIWENSGKTESLISKIRRNGTIEYLLLQPQTFMNLSGRSVSKTLKTIGKEIQLVIIFDDLDIPLGKYKISKGKFPKDHNGINDIAKYLPIDQVIAVRIGVDNRGDLEIPGDRYVIKKYSENEIQLLNEVIIDACNELYSLITK